jgi:hypothetical protein
VAVRSLQLDRSLTSSLLLALYGLLFGALVGGLLHVVLYAMQRWTRDFAVTAMQPTSYDIVVDVDVADQAAHELESRGQSWRLVRRRWTTADAGSPATSPRGCTEMVAPAQPALAARLQSSDGSADPGSQAPLSISE